MDAAKNKIQGRVFVSFYINKEGKEVDIKLERGKHPLLDRAAINQVANMPYWTPGKKKGKLSKIKYTVPINFTLQ
ncbi:MAG: TonB family protein [Marinilabiliaceae bacterium]|nr:TonB family protein [Marinilabiliaceae bacterium]